MSEESGQRSPVAKLMTTCRLSEPEHLRCPRCESTNTKFYYYNNYSLSQPRHFCKSCRRYWTRGGVLRCVPVGGGIRKSKKRPRTTTTVNPTASATTSSSSSTLTYDPLSANPGSVVVPVSKAESRPGSPSCGDLLNLNDALVDDAGGFMSVLNTQQDTGFGPLTGFGLGLESGFHGMGFGTWDWPVEQVGQVIDGTGGGGNASGESFGCNTWQIAGGVQGGLMTAADCFTSPELPVSTPAKGVN